MTILTNSRLLRTITLLITIFFLSLPAYAKYSGGTGEPNDPYLIYTAEQMITIGTEPNDWDKHFKLIVDIDLTEYSFETALIAPDVDPCDLTFQGMSFSGTLDGSGHIISNLMISGEHYLGLFGRLEYGAVIKNLAVVDVNITGSDYIGGLVGFSKGNIANSYCTGTVNGNRFVGGLTGRNWGNINASCSMAVVTANSKVGGLAAGNYGSITDSYNTGAVTANLDAGGLVYANSGSISTSYSTGKVSGENRAGGLVGYNQPDIGIVSGFWDVEASGMSTSDGGTGKTTAEMQTADTFLDAGWDFVDETANGTEDIWWIVEGKDYPRLWWETRLDDWIQCSSMKTARNRFAGSVIGDEIFVFGGNSNDGWLYSGEKYNALTDTWSYIADNPYNGLWGIEEISGIGFNSKFYVFGARSFNELTGTPDVINYNEMYDPTTDEWTTLAKKPTAKISIPVVYNGKIYLFGGDSYNEVLNEYTDYTIVEAYDPAKNEWEQVTKMPKILFNTAIAVHNDSAYLIAGYDYDEGKINDEVIVYNFQTKDWIRNYCHVPDEAARVYSYITQTPVIDGKAYLTGGVEGDSENHWVSDKFNIFDIETKSWESGPVLPEPRAFHLTVAVDNTIYVIGGENPLYNDNKKDTVFTYTLPVYPDL